MKRVLILCSLLHSFIIPTHSAPESSNIQLNHALATAQNALTNYRNCAPESDFRNLLAYLRYYRSWYQATTPAPLRLIEQLSPEALQFIAQLKHSARSFLQHPSKNVAGASKLSTMGERFYQAIIDMTKKQLIDGEPPAIMTIPHLRSQLF